MKFKADRDPSKRGSQQIIRFLFFRQNDGTSVVRNGPVCAIRLLRSGTYNLSSSFIRSTVDWSAKNQQGALKVEEKDRDFHLLEP